MSYSRWSKDHAHILPRPVHLPAWGALTIPYRWMLKESGFEIARDLDLDADEGREPTNPDWLQRTSWIQGFSNQTALLEAFAEPFEEDESLVLFYCPRTPISDDERRVLVGAALLKKKHELVEYSYDSSNETLLKAMVWERPIQHSLRRLSDGKFSGGFLLPYHEILRLVEQNPALDTTDLVAFAPDDARAQFSYGSEQVTHGIAAAALLSARKAFVATGQLLDGPWENSIAWIDERLSRLWKLQGPAPGLGAALSALHAGFNGTLFAIALADELEANADPWPVIDAIFTGKRKPPAEAPAVTGMLRKRWERLQGDSEQLDLLKLIARLELTRDQARRALDREAGGILANPYLLFEQDRSEPDPISFHAVDRGLLPGREIEIAHGLPSRCNPDLAEYDNGCRLRAACVQLLEAATADGHSVLPVEAVKDATGRLSTVHEIPLDHNTIDICRYDFAPVVAVSGERKDMMVQLNRYVTIGKLLRKAVDDRLGEISQHRSVNWRQLVDERFGCFAKEDTDEELARVEKATALERLASSRIGLLIGPAGTGKTTVLRVLLDQQDLVGTRVLLLAPTGKARVRLAQETGQGAAVQTVAQFLLGMSRFDADTGRYFTNPEGGTSGATCCILDESSMLTEDMLAAVVDALSPSCRLVLVGDPHQLPPIGAGCPFVDIIGYLDREHGGRGISELTTPRRHADDAHDERSFKPALARADVQLAAIFSGRPLPPGEDEIITSAIECRDEDTVRYRQWDNPTDLQTIIEEALATEFGCTPDGLSDALEISLGATRNEKGYLNFDPGSSRSVSDWQVLTVNRNAAGGSIFLNRRIKESLRRERLKQAVDSNQVPYYRDWMRFVKPRGAEQIVYGDKVICVRNHKRAPWLYETRKAGEKEFVANGELGVVTGLKQFGKKSPRFTHIELAGRSDRNFSFGRGDFSEDGLPYLELAYAITVHKAQGSEFGIVILVLPALSRLVSREMLYTALTRQKRRIWILHQGPFEKFLAYRHCSFSDIATRFTNLLRTSTAPPARPSGDAPSGSSRGFLEERLIHRTTRGEMVSSKNELAIGNLLHVLEKEGLIRYQVEPQLPFDDGRGRWADFLVEAKGQTWYWEHCGMMADGNYRGRWQTKKAMYAANGYTVWSEMNPGGRLIVTEDGPQQGLDTKAIEEFARRLFT
jgi:hypothetical protein